jgi:hypothetical protein
MLTLVAIKWRNLRWPAGAHRWPLVSVGTKVIQWLSERADGGRGSQDRCSFLRQFSDEVERRRPGGTVALRSEQ